MALLLALGVVTWEHVIHAYVLGHGGGLVAHVTHVLRDGLLAVPVALLAVYAVAELLARTRGTRTLTATAGLVSLAYTVLMVPSGVVHHLIEQRSVGMVVPHTAVGGLEGAHTIGGMILHALRDAAIGQLAALPLALLALAWLARPRTERRLIATRPRLALVLGLACAMLLAPMGQAGAQTGDRTGALFPGVCSIAPQRVFNVSAINVRITVNKFGDSDPFGFMYALNGRIPAIRAQEATRQVTTGLRQDAIQPLMIRANLGDCVTINFTNALTAPPQGGPNNAGAIIQPGGVPSVSLMPQGVSYQTANAGGGVGNNDPAAMVAPGATRQYKFFMDPLSGEGAKIFTSGGESRQLTAHGLFGAIIAEPIGSRWFDPESGADKTNDANWANWEAIIDPPGSARAFREFGIMYHEIGDENFNLAQPDAAVPGDTRVPMIDNALSEAYRPNSRALNYRSEPFWRRLQIANESQRKALGYSSYTFGDPATPIPRSYVGEPVKTRLMAPGGELLHVHHLHGGGDRWRQNPDADDTAMFSGLDKTPVLNAKSIRLDSQTVGPGESFNLEHECGAGGCQAGVGDFLYHCHIAHHYIGGMWSFWRVFDTRQTATGPHGERPLAVVPGMGTPPTAVNSTGLINKVIEGKTVKPAAQVTNPSTEVALETLVEGQLPPRGVQNNPDDATVWNYEKAGTAAAPLYRGEPETTAVFANYNPSATTPGPGNRPDILFNPNNGRPAWPLFRPHLNTRPPFSPNKHSGAPYLGDTVSATRPDGLCPASAPVKTFNITAITLPIATTDTETDPDGQIFVLNEDKAAVLAGTKPAEPLAIRSNVGDCVALTMTSELNATLSPKVNMHTHFVQFDTQASDGVITGQSYEQSLKPVSTESRTLAAAAAAGATTITTTNVTGLRAGISIAIGQGRPNIELRNIRSISGNTITLDQALSQAHSSGEPTGVEFVQHRWYSDVDSGTVFWHDHVDGIKAWGHGLFAAHIIEPTGSTYHDPVTGAQVRSGAIVDIRTSGSVGVGQSGSFREYMLWLHNGREGNPDDNNFNNGQECEEGSINLKAEPFTERVAVADRTVEQNGGVCGTFLEDAAGTPVLIAPGDVVGTKDPHVFSSVKYGDPRTPLLRAYVGDPVVIRTIGLAERVEALKFQGHRFRRERFHAQGELTDTASTGISERFDYVLDGGAGGPKRMAGDYLYYSSRQQELEQGAWGIFRVHDKQVSNLQPLPGRNPATGTGGFPRLTRTGGAPPAPTSADVNPATCPSSAPVKTFDVSIFNVTLPSAPSQDTEGVVYALTADRPNVNSGNVEPLVIRANAGDCVVVNLRNELTAGTRINGTRAGFNLAKLPFDPLRSAGTAVGFNPDSTVAIGGTYTYRFHADRELGTSIFLNLGSPATLLHGAYGALIVEPAGATYHNNVNNAQITSGPTAIIRIPGFLNDFREFVPLFTTTDPQQGRSVIPYSEHVMGLGLPARAPVNAPEPGFNHVNYRSAPLTTRLAANPNHGLVFSNSLHGNPATTTYTAHAGDPVRFRAAVPASQQFHTFSLDAHMFPMEPYFSGLESSMLGARALTAGEVQEAKILAGTTLFQPGDYRYQDSRLAWRTAGLWGIFRVLPFNGIGAEPQRGETPTVAPLNDEQQ